MLISSIQFFCTLSIFLLSAQQSQADQLAQPEEHIHSDAVCSDSIANIFVGNIDSMKYHRNDCEFARLMSRRKRIHFNNESAAVFAGMKACNWCLPRWTLQVQGCLLRENTSALNAAAGDGPVSASESSAPDAKPLSASESSGLNPKKLSAPDSTVISSPEAASSYRHPCRRHPKQHS
jgi:hypothetical protein